jgi:hypothetical protein
MVANTRLGWTLVICWTSLFSPSSASWDYGWPSEWDSKWLAGATPDASLQFPSSSLGTSDSDCVTSHLTAYEMEKGRKPINFTTDPLDHPLNPKILPLNSTGGEQYEFDGVSADGTMAFCFGFYRDPNYAILGTGNLRTSVEIAHPNGTRFMRVDYPTESIVQSCPWGTRGVWRTKTYNYTFEVTRDMKAARIGVLTDDLRGNVLLESRMPARYPDGTTYPNAEAKTEIVPYYHWVEPMPVATTHVDLQINNEPYVFTGIGGHERLWSAFSWFTCLRNMSGVRVSAGPYDLSYLAFDSAMTDKYAPSALLTEDGEPVFRATRSTPSTTEDFALLTKTYGGRVTGNLKDKASGFEVVLVSPSTKRQWSFVITNKNVGFEYMLGDGAGGTGFSGRAVGGAIGMKQFEGPAFAEILTFPKSSFLFKPNYVDPLPPGKEEL